MNKEKSKKAFEAARKVLPGGVNSPVRAFRAVGGEPIFVKQGEGAWIEDVDGNRYVDYVCSWGPLILGHAHPEVIEALRERIGKGTSFGIPTELETELARKVIRAVPSMERVRFVNSGTEATMSAVRVARGGFRWQDGIYTIQKPEGIVFKTRPGRIMVLDDEFSPVILEVMAKSDVKSFDAFKAKVEACDISMDGPVLRYKTIYGDVLTLDTRYQKTPTIDGRPVDYAPKKVFESPFLNADYNSGIVTISKGHRKKVLDFGRRE